MAAGTSYPGPMSLPLKPLLLLDVDGVVLPLDTLGFGRPAPAPPAYMGAFRRTEVNRLQVRVAEHLLVAAAQLHELFEIRWATSWEDEANGDLTDLLGWPRLECLPIYQGMKMRPPLSRPEVIKAHCGCRPLVWCDDTGVNDKARVWVAERVASGIPTLAIRPQRHLGITPRQLSRILRFAATT